MWLIRHSRKSCFTRKQIRYTCRQQQRPRSFKLYLSGFTIGEYQNGNLRSKHVTKMSRRVWCITSRINYYNQIQYDHHQCHICRFHYHPKTKPMFSVVFGAHDSVWGFPKTPSTSHPKLNYKVWLAFREYFLTKMRHIWGTPHRWSTHFSHTPYRGAYVPLTNSISKKKIRAA